jgi:e3 binding domain
MAQKTTKSQRSGGSRSQSRGSNGRKDSAQGDVPEARPAEEARQSENVSDRQYRRYEIHEEQDPAGPPDVLLAVPELRIDLIHFQLDDLDAHVALKANVLNLVKLNVGADVHLSRVKLDIRGIEAQVVLKARLDHVSAIVDRLMTSLDRNPELVKGLSRAVAEIGQGAGQAVDKTGDAAKDVGKGAESALQDVGKGAGSAVGDVGEGAGQAVGDVGQGAGQAVGDVGQGAGQAVGDVGQGGGQAVGDVGQGAGQAVGDVGQGAGQAVGDVGQTVGQAGQGVTQALGGGQAQPDGGQAQPDGGQAQPDGGQAQPDGGQAQPDGGQAQPDGDQAQPGGQAQDGGGGPQQGQQDGQPNGGAPEDMTPGALAKGLAKTVAHEIGQAASDEAKDIGLAATRKVRQLGERRQQRRAEKHHATDAATRLADELGVDLGDLEGTGSDGRITVRDVREAQEA